MLNTNCGQIPIANMSSVTGKMTNFSPRTRSEKPLQLWASGPLKSACIARMKVTAVKRRPSTEMAVSEAVIKDLQKYTTEGRVHVDNGRCRSCRDREKTKQAITKVIDRQVSDHSFEVALGPGRERREDDRANHQREQPRPGDFDFVREKRNEQANETIDAHLRKRAGQHHRHTGRRRLIGIGQPGVKWKEWDFDSEPEENSGKGEPLKFAGEQPAFSETGERREIECSFGKINSEKGKKHGDAAEKCVNEKFNRGVISSRACGTAINFDEEKRRNEAHFVKQKPENEILGGEGAVKRGERIKDERNGARVLWLPDVKRDRTGQGNQNDDAD